ncbi:MAG: ATP synthase F1 subunit epsilon [Endomicrobium sp.]|jgi:F-type H+-transporting ATPase subunit epsilon|nr:ATP synthase F1 subunit epsilon [Endomicrobium sp.]
MSELEIEILSPQGTVFKGELSSVSFPTASGIITVMSGHANLVTKLRNGEIAIESQSGTKKIAVSGGFIEIANNHVNVVAEFAAQSDETNRQKIEMGVKLAKDIKDNRRKFIDMSITESELKKATVELKSKLVHKQKRS